MIPVNDLRAGIYFQENNEPYKVVEYKHVKVGRGNANIKIKACNLKTGSVLEKSYLSGGRVEEIQIERQKVQFLYSDQNNVFFMDPQNFEQFEIAKKIVGSALNFMKEALELELVKWEDEILGVELSNSVELTVTETGPSERGDSAGSVTKPATLETGYVVQVPMFVKNGDRLKIDTRTGTYAERVN
ncbi:elongation factor P [candidate division WWE3 bacterium CG06_land_8_20_14_3_00_42_16]|uniref:Elongation factor P n=4 Tax=Katanobacteria TaxID=422282 RepID=A0A2M7ALV2_UNCKA|nr:MAG: elongation factor P [bacterium CG1_02_42_9]PIU68389.1 MAG: elongation factor P [candidate division WWE3 bacterium CG06_land_8_20_14_3_00_42_16]PIZ42918.1 MAG: elongation factor P [candidate division WWE3 bacterium CG_4_10_14_0_2_um_filter_42_8]PJA38597.1 MAG: elongation factor P [candidate division WWE3 bacterium CG_4_9_14_3_um_filter_43_9]PJC68364.1 MAG: elongation factor P [candidate division WWE3 bacterium CG_4_8_14_3_um_filter_42_11]